MTQLLKASWIKRSRHKAWKKPWSRWSARRSPCEWRCPIESLSLNDGYHFLVNRKYSNWFYWPQRNDALQKGDRSHCGNYRGISLFSIVGKVFADIILQRLKKLAELIYVQSQSGYRSGRSTIDGIFTLRQLMEKSREQRRNMYIAFVDFTKAFDTVNREFMASWADSVAQLNSSELLRNCIQMYMQDLSSTVNLQALLTTTAVLNKAVN